MRRDLIAVAVGGVVGTGLRLSIDAAIPHSGTEFPWSTLIVNLSGALALGLIVGGLWKRPGLPHWVRSGLGTGVIGSYTTFSAVMVSLVALSSAGAAGEAAIYLAASVLLGFPLAAVGLRVGTRVIHRRMPRSVDDAGETL